MVWIQHEGPVDKYGSLDYGPNSQGGDNTTGRVIGNVPWGAPPCSSKQEDRGAAPKTPQEGRACQFSFPFLCLLILWLYFVAKQLKVLSPGKRRRQRPSVLQSLEITTNPILSPNKSARGATPSYRGSAPQSCRAWTGPRGPMGSFPPIPLSLIPPIPHGGPNAHHNK